MNEVLPRDELLVRAWELAESIMQRPRMIRRMTHAITVRPWRKLVAEDMGFHIAHLEMGILGNREPFDIHSILEARMQQKD